MIAVATMEEQRVDLDAQAARITEELADLSGYPTDQEIAQALSMTHGRHIVCVFAGHYEFASTEQSVY